MFQNNLDTAYKLHRGIIPSYKFRSIGKGLNNCFLIATFSISDFSFFFFYNFVLSKIIFIFNSSKIYRSIEVWETGINEIEFYLLFSNNESNSLFLFIGIYRRNSSFSRYRLPSIICRNLSCRARIAKSEN